MDFTPSQNLAINHGKDNILVCAAAGSGKTTVLCNRIVKRIIEGKTDLSSILVVTFTVAAAEDLKVKLKKNLKEAELKAAGEQREYIRNQIAKLPYARISTIHSFALEVIRSDFDKLSLPAKIRVADDFESEGIGARCMDAAIEECYKNDEDGSFNRLFDLLVTDRDEKLSDYFLSLYKTLSNHPEGIEYVRKNSDEILKYVGKDPFSTPYGKRLKEGAEEFLRYCIPLFESAVCLYDEAGLTANRNRECFQTALDISKELTVSLNEGCAQFMHSLSGISYPKFTNAKKIEEHVYYKEVFAHFREMTENNGSRLGFNFSLSTLDDDLYNTSSYLSSLYAVLSIFDKKFGDEKRKRGIVDFTDIERMTYKLLVNENGEPTDIAKGYAEGFDELYIDEYQDTNRIQDSIFRALSNKNMFIVGDIKQSIYGFRGACPDIFSRYRKDGFKDGGEKIFLSENFRSDENVIEFSNGVFSGIMGGVNTVDYRREDDLVYSKNNPLQNEKVDIILVKEDKDNGISQASTVAKYIGNQIANGVRPEDIAVLCRSMTKSVNYLVEECEKLGIGMSLGGDEEYFKKPWIQLVLCILKAIDNKTKDIYVAGALRGELFGFDMDMLVRVRKKYPSEEYLFSALDRYVSSDDDGRDEDIVRLGRAFIDFIEEMREIESGCPVDELVRTVIERSRVIEACSYGRSISEGDMIRSDILKIYSMAKDCTSRGVMGLSSFLSYLDEVMESGKGERCKNISPGQVRLMTIHASKGLQYPVCILYNGDKAFRLSSEKDSPILYSEELGLGFKLSDKGQPEKKHDTLLTASIGWNYAMRQREEEMRLLYVAFTRAENKLAISGKCSDFEFDSPFISDREMYRTANSYLEWVRCRLGKIEGERYNILKPQDIISPESCEAQKEQAREVMLDENDRIRLDNIIKHYCGILSGVPAKANVSELTPDFLDVNEDMQDTEEKNKEIRLPDFMTGKVTDLGAKKGTATHLFMQFCNYDECRKKGVENELERLTERGFIDGDTASLVDVNKVERFFSSELFRMIEKGDKVMREKRFNVKLGADMFTLDEDKRKHLEGKELLVQGVVDCMFFDEKGELILVDYKTDGFSNGISEERIRDILKERYRNQIKYYLYALDVIYPSVKKKAYIYSFALDNHIEMDV